MRVCVCVKWHAAFGGWWLSLKRGMLSVHRAPSLSRADTAVIKKKRKRKKTDGDVYTRAPHRTFRRPDPHLRLAVQTYAETRRPPKTAQSGSHITVYCRTETARQGTTVLRPDRCSRDFTWRHLQTQVQPFMQRHCTARWKIWIILWTAYILNLLVVVSTRLNSPPLVNNVNFEKQSFRTLHKTSLFGVLFMLFIVPFITDLDIQELICDICSASVHDSC